MRRWAHAGLRASIGVARREVTPDLAVRARCWGPARHDLATGVHRPLTLTAMAVKPCDGDKPLVLISADLTWWRRSEDERALRGALLDGLELDESRLLFHLVHTHAGPTLSTGESELPGGDRTSAYLHALAGAAVDAAGEAFDEARPAVLEWTTTSCSLAATRDLRADDRRLVGFDPSVEADATMLVGRVAEPGSGTMIATLVNYACHPTTLGWENELLSPDYVGAARELVEDATDGAPCLFLQGASGELAPREQYGGDPSVADRHGRAVGHAAAGALEAMLPPGRALVHAGVVESGAPLADWRLDTHDHDETVLARRVVVDLEAKPPPTAEELEERWAGLDTRTREERMTRAAQLNGDFDGGATVSYPIWIWRLGAARLLAHPGEAYSMLQRGLRLAEPVTVVMNLTNGPGFFYLPPEALYDEEAYAVWQTMAARGSLERVLTDARAELESLDADGNGIR